MADECMIQTDKGINIHGILLSPVIAFVGLSYFVWNGMDGVVAMITILSVLLIMSLILSVIPYGGFIIYGITAYFWFIPKLIDITGITHDWLLNLVFAYTILFGLTITIAVTYYIREF